MRLGKNSIGTVAAGAALLVLATALAGCAGETTGNSGEVTITFWDNNGGSDRSPVYEELIAEFEEENPGIRVEYVGIPAASHVEKFQTAVAGGTPPDVGIVNNTLAASLSIQNALEPLDEFLAESDLSGRIAEDALETARTSVADGGLYLLPQTSTTSVLWYRADWFEDAGIAEPETWGDFFRVAESITDKPAGRYGFVLRGAAGSVAQLTDFVVSCSGIESYFDDGGKSTFSSPEVVNCIDQFAALYGTATSEADLAYGYQEMVTAFDSSKGAMMQHNLGSSQNHLDAYGPDVVHGAPLPLNDASRQRTIQTPNAEGPAIFSGSEHKAEAWKLAEFLLSHEANSLWNQRAGQIPANIDARNDQWIRDSQPLAAATDALADPKTVMVKTPTYLPDWSSILSSMEPDFQSLLLNEMSAEDFAGKWANLLTEAEADYRENVRE